MKVTENYQLQNACLGSDRVEATTVARSGSLRRTPARYIARSQVPASRVDKAAGIRASLVASPGWRQQCASKHVAGTDRANGGVSGCLQLPAAGVPRVVYIPPKDADP